MTTKKNIETGIIVALDENNGIGHDGDLLCHLPNDLKHFKEVTSGHTVIMGRKTYESLPKGALPNRTNVVITADSADKYPGCIVARSVDEALTYSKEGEKIFIIGGGQLYRTTLELVDWLYLTRIHHTFNNADTFFPKIEFEEWTLIQKEEHDVDDRHQYPYTFLTYRRK
jgi:dihydrofolate reductase